MAGNVKFARIHGRIVPIRQGGGAGKRAPAKVAPKKKAPAPQKRLSGGQRVAFGLGSAAAGWLAFDAARPAIKAATSFVGAKIANVGLKKAGKSLVSQGNFAQAQKLGQGFINNIRVQRAAKGLLKNPMVLTGAALGGLWGAISYAYGKAAVTGGGNRTGGKKAAPRTSP